MSYVDSSLFSFETMESTSDADKLIRIVELEESNPFVFI